MWYAEWQYVRESMIDCGDVFFLFFYFFYLFDAEWQYVRESRIDCEDVCDKSCNTLEREYDRCVCGCVCVCVR
jgi:hypothetical protein